MNGETLEIQSASSVVRLYTILILAAFGAFFLFVTLRNQTPGYQFGFVLGGACFWCSLYWVFLPRIKVVADFDGMEFVDLRSAALFLYPRYRIAWQDVLEIDTRKRTGEHSVYFETRLKVRVSEPPLRTRTFSVTDQDPGYHALLKVLKERVESSPVPVSGLGLQPDRMRTLAQRSLLEQVALIVVLSIVAILIITVAYFAR